MNIARYEELSNEIKDKKTNVFNALASLHDDLCDIAKDERELESERESGVTYVRGLAHNAPELVEHLEAHNKQLVLPTQKVWSLVDNAISLVDAANKSAMNDSVDQLPAIFSVSNRVQEFTTGK